MRTAFDDSLSSHSLAGTNRYRQISEMLVARVFAVAVAVAAVVELHPLEALPFVRGRKWIRKLRCLSEASFEAFPFFALHKWEPEGQACGRLSFAYYFFGEAKKSK